MGFSLYRQKRSGCVAMNMPYTAQSIGLLRVGTTQSSSAQSVMNERFMDWTELACDFALHVIKMG